MDFKRGGRITKKTATTFMQVSDVPDVMPDVGTDGPIDNTGKQHHGLEQRDTWKLV